PHARDRPHVPGRLRARRDPRAAGGRPRRPDDRTPGGDQLPRAPPGRAPPDRGRTRRHRLLPGGARARTRVPVECGRPRPRRKQRRRSAAPLRLARLSPGRSRRHGPRQARLVMTSRVGTGLGGWLLPFVLSATAGSVDVMRGPFADANSPMAVLVGMLAVATMATQNALTKPCR